MTCDAGSVSGEHFEKDYETDHWVHVRRALPTPGVFRVLVFANAVREGACDRVGAFEAVRSG